MNQRSKNASDKLDMTRILKKNSFRHHYIPKFVTKAFTNSNGKAFVFDKLKNEILPRQKAPKSIFYEFDRNTVEVNEEISSSFIEDQFYSRIDDQASKTILYFRNRDLKQIDFTVENTGYLSFFLITLFWRIPYTDSASEDVINRSEITTSDIDQETLKKDPFFKKTQRVFHAKQMIEEIGRVDRKVKTTVNIHEIKSNSFLLGDNPILFRKTSNEFGKLFDNDFLFALSSNRIYSSTEKPLQNFSTINAYTFNASVIQQSKRYICANEKVVLEKSIELYQEFLRKGIADELIESAFKNHE